MYVCITRNGVLIGPRAFGARVYGLRCVNIYTSTHACPAKMRSLMIVQSLKLYEIGFEFSMCVYLKLILSIIIINV